MSRILFDSFDGGTPASPLPFPSATTQSYAAMLASLFPRGRLWRFVTSQLSSLLTGCADELARVHARVTDLLNEADPTTATELLPEYESELKLSAAPTIDERRANIVGRLVNRQRYRPVDFQQAMAPLLQQQPADVVVIERTPAQAAALGDAREIKRFFVYRDPALPGTAFVASAQALVDTMKRATTIGTVIESIALTCGDPHSLVGRDTLKGP